MKGKYFPAVNEVAKSFLHRQGLREILKVLKSSYPSRRGARRGKVPGRVYVLPG